jgi:ornithine carbamoyltransferase
MILFRDSKVGSLGGNVMLKGKDLLSIHDLSVDEFSEILSLAKELKSMQKAGIEHHILQGKTLGMIFEKSSTRTRVSFETGMYQLGGQALFLSNRDLQLGRGRADQGYCACLVTLS